MIDVVREEGYRENPSMQEQTDTHITPYHLKSLLVPTQLIRLGKCEYMGSFARGWDAALFFFFWIGLDWMGGAFSLFCRLWVLCDT